MTGQILFTLADILFDFGELEIIIFDSAFFRKILCNELDSPERRVVNPSIT